MCVINITDENDSFNISTTNENEDNIIFIKLFLSIPAFVLLLCVMCLVINKMIEILLPNKW